MQNVKIQRKYTRKVKSFTLKTKHQITKQLSERIETHITKSSVKQKKKDYYENEASKLTSMSNDSPRKFWKYVKNLKKKSKTNKDELNVNVFFEHFKRMSNSLRLEGDHVNESRENIGVNINIR